MSRIKSRLHSNDIINSFNDIEEKLTNSIINLSTRLSRLQLPGCRLKSGMRHLDLIIYSVIYYAKTLFDLCTDNIYKNHRVTFIPLCYLKSLKIKQKHHDIVYGSKPAIAVMHGPHSVFDNGHCTVIHCGTGGVSLVDQ